MSENSQPGNLMPKEELAASGSGHLLLTDFDDDEKEDAEDSMVEFANQQGRRTPEILELRDMCIVGPFD